MNTSITDETGTQPADGASHRHRQDRRLLKMVVWIVFLAALAAGVGWSVRHGWALRDQAWEFFAPGRHTFDIGRNYYFGRMAVQQGMVNLYDDQSANPPDPARRLNYTPLRTAVFAAWARSNGEPKPESAQPSRRGRRGQDWGWEPQIEFNRFLQDFNISMGLAGAVAAGLLVQHWMRRQQRGTPMPAHEPTPGWRYWPWAAAAIAFWLYWYNPAGLILGHGWPSPNAWLMPFFLWALLLASWGWWFVAGAMIGLGAMFQGQQLLVAPFWVLWPIFAGQPMRAVKWTIGFAFAFMLVVWEWSLTVRPDAALPDRALNWSAISWIIAGVVGVLAVPAVRWWLARMAARGAVPETAEPPAGLEGLEFDDLDIAPAGETEAESSIGRSGRVSTRLIVMLAVSVIAAGVLAGPAVWTLGLFSLWGGVTVLLAIGLVALLWWRGWRVARYGVPAVVAAQLLLCVPVFGASSSWWDVGFLYGTERHMDLAVGSASNLGKLLQTSYGWRKPDDVVTTISASTLFGWPAQDKAVEIRHVMNGIYALTLVLSSIATAIQWRRNNRNFLLAATVPWVLMALIPAQMHERYLGFAALGAVVWIGASGGVGWMLLGLMYSLMTYAQVLHQMIPRSRNFDTLDPWLINRDWYRVFEGLYPQITWALLLGAAVVLYASFRRASCPAERLAARLG